MPILILVMTTMLNVSMTVAPQTGVETVAEGFDHVWQTIGSVSGESAGMSKIGMRSINRLYFFAVVTCIFVGRNFRSGYVKILFIVRAKKADCMLSRTLVCCLAAAQMRLAFLAGSMLGGAIAGLTFALGDGHHRQHHPVHAGEDPADGGVRGHCGSVERRGRQKLWLSLVGSPGVGMLLFMMILMLIPLDATLMNALISLLDSEIFGVGLGRSAVVC